MVGVDLWKISSKRTGESDAQIVESQNNPLHIGNYGREGFRSRLPTWIDT
jgi:hypothetical protein